ncbi:sulfatase-like hydrolase/transferase [Chelativorans sp. J32]|uniref:sulfatase-like hydrolase/transferase n=1 Tax=Chelativorans sp. J32 TaxID=935840 RepID=UPI0004825089|nr:sulfatase-like hydrolase/transferase [Chelativorans sp. J32]
MKFVQSGDPVGEVVSLEMLRKQVRNADDSGVFTADLEEDIWLVNLFVLAGLSIGAVLLFIALLFRVPRWVADCAFALGLFLLLADVFSPVQLGRLDGADVTSPEPLTYTFLEGAIGLGIIVLAFALHKRGSNLGMYAFFSGLLAIVCAVLFVLLPRPHAAAVENASSRSTLPNIYHFHLDELQSDYALEAIRNGGLEEELNGFTFFSRNTSNYPYTRSSVPSYLTSTIYKGDQTFQEWVQSFDQGLLQFLKNSGYRLEIIGLPEHLRTPLADSFRSPQDIFKEETGLKHPQLPDFVSLVSAKALPNILTNEALGWGADLGRRAGAILERPRFEGDVPLTVEEGVHPFQGMVALQYAAKQERYRPSTGNYLLLQAILPHGPYIFDESCSLGQDKLKLPAAYGRQSKCAVRLVAAFIEQLKDLGRYDKSIIIIQSDHGSGWAGFLGGGGDKARYAEGITAFGGTKRAFEARTMATLIIKPAEERAPFKVSEARSQLIDVYPTAADLIGDRPNGDLAGTSLLNCLQEECSQLDKRELLFFVYPHERDPGPIYQNSVEFVSGRASIRSIWPFAPDD